jgi:hypothetical protein
MEDSLNLSAQGRVEVHHEQLLTGNEVGNP